MHIAFRIYTTRVAVVGNEAEDGDAVWILGHDPWFDGLRGLDQ